MSKSRDEDRPNKDTKKPLKAESLEERILLSATWVDADSGEELDGPTDGDDLLYGSGGDDIADALGGDDELFGGAGDDSLFGNSGDDRLAGGDGDDLLDGGSGNDTVTYADGTTRVITDLEAGTSVGQGSDTLVGIENVEGSAHNDIITGDDNANVLDGGAGDDYIDGAAGDDTLLGGAGDDIVVGGTGDDVVAGGLGDDLLVGGEGDDTLSYDAATGPVTVDLDAGTATGEGTDTLDGFEHVIGSGGDDTLLGSTTADRLEGGSGDDVIQGRGGNDVLKGGAGRDTISGGAGDDQIEGGTGEDLIEGGEGADTIDAGADDDTVYGDAGDDLIDGGEGDDTLYGGVGNDTLTGGLGNDTLEGGEGDDLLTGGAGHDVITGGEGADTVSYREATGPINANLGTGTATGEGTDTLSEVENIEGSDFGDTLVGDAGANVLEGFAGDDTITGGAGADSIYGGAGDDVLVVDADDAVIEGGEGYDRAVFSASGAGVEFDLTLASVEAVTGSGHDDVFVFSAPEAGAVYSVDGGGGHNVIDLSGFDAGDVTIDAEAGVATVSLPGGGSIEIQYQGVDQFYVDGLESGPVLATAEAATVGESEQVSVAATMLSEPGASVSVQWTQVSGPVVELTGADTQTPSFTTPELDASTTIRLKATLDDGTQTTTQYVTFGVSAENDPVVVDAGLDQIVAEGDQVTLDADVVDPEDSAVSVTWTQISGPDVELSDSDTTSPSFEAPELSEDADLVFQITASDGTADVVDTVTIHVEAADDAAVADAGVDLVAEEGDTVQLSGSATDPDSTELTYSWQIGR
ncbi:MAG: hypothetical protein ACF8NJ_06155, partial [Phycisphaerales bacterium JB038]